jgi:SAM-dependent methyltransferase
MGDSELDPPFFAGRTPHLYGELAYLWPTLSPPEHYEAEARVVELALESHLPSLDRPCRLLELGAGGGHVLAHLGPNYDVTAVDVSEAMLKNCARQNPDARCLVGDMRSLRLDEQFDAVLIHDSADYLLNAEDVQRTLATSFLHLRKGGVLLLAPTYVEDDFESGESESDALRTDAVDVTYLSYVHDPDPNDTTFEMILVYLIKNHPGGHVQVLEDRHTCGLFSVAHWLEAMKKAGFDTNLWEPSAKALGDFDPPTWKLFLGQKR